MELLEILLCSGWATEHRKMERPVLKTGREIEILGVRTEVQVQGGPKEQQRTMRLESVI